MPNGDDETDVFDSMPSKPSVMNVGKTRMNANSSTNGTCLLSVLKNVKVITSLGASIGHEREQQTRRQLLIPSPLQTKEEPQEYRTTWSTGNHTTQGFQDPAVKHQ